jgi:DNA-directed RNA polymerase subunit RPC12/RpoP
MKYYCENCGAEWDTMKIDYSRCPFCKHEGLVVEFPARETVEQWEKRKGRKYPDTAPVYQFIKYPPVKYNGIVESAKAVWTVQKYAMSIGWAANVFDDAYMKKGLFKNLFVVATEAGAPPDDWRPGD